MLEHASSFCVIHQCYLLSRVSLLFAGFSLSLSACVALPNRSDLVHTAPIAELLRHGDCAAYVDAEAVRAPAPADPLRDALARPRLATSTPTEFATRSSWPSATSTPPAGAR